MTVSNSTKATDNAGAIYVAHVFVVAALATAAFMMMTAVELGPMGPLVSAEGIYLGAFAFLIEFGLAARAVLLTAKRAVSRRRSPHAQGAR